jgi:small subunit ribosomal protein S6
VSRVDSGCQILLPPLVGAIRWNGCPKEVKAITDRNGVVTDTDFWGKRRFAYEIDHMTEGYYSVITFDGEVELQDTLGRSLSLLDSVVRHKIMKPSS